MVPLAAPHPPPIYARCVRSIKTQLKMPKKIHSSAIVHPRAELSDDAIVGPFSVVGPNTYLGPGSRVGSHVVIEGDVWLEGDVVVDHHATLTGPIRLSRGVRIGAHTYIVGLVSVGEETIIFNHCSIGADAQHPDSVSSSSGIRIGARTILREFVTLHKPTADTPTSIGADCYVMAYCHIAHDCRVGERVKMANAATLAGFVVVDDGAYLGLHSVIHQRLHVGRTAMVGMNSAVLKHVPPYANVVNGIVTKINRRGMSLQGIPLNEIDAVERFYRDRDESGDGSLYRDAVSFFFKEHDDNSICKIDLK
jgi:UDP-N-acetylglucosamine acyltransferase